MATGMWRSRGRCRGSVLTGLVAGAVVCVAVVSIDLPARAGIKPHDPSMPISTASVPGGRDSHNDPADDSGSEVYPIETRVGPDLTSAVLATLGGLAVAGAGLGVTVGLRRRRDHEGSQGVR